MSTSFLGLNETPLFDKPILGLKASTIHTALPILASLLGTLGVLSGTTTLLAPLRGAKLFGLLLSGSDLTPTEKAYTRVHGVRNVASGVSLIGLAVYSIFTGSRVVAAGVRVCIGFTLLAGTIVSVGDGMILRAHAETKGTDLEARELARETGRKHVLMAVPVVGLALAHIYL